MQSKQPDTPPVFGAPRSRSQFFNRAPASRSPARCEVRQSADGEAAELLIYGAIYPGDFFPDEISAKQVIEAIASIGDKPIVARINSPGGVVTEGMAIYHALRNHKAGVTCVVDGLAASAASVVLMASDKRAAAGPGAFVMIHNAWGVSIGDKSDAFALAEILEKMDGTIAGIYGERSTMTDAEIVAAMDAETWFTAKEAQAAGLITEIQNASEAEIQASARQFDLAGFDRVPKNLLASERRSPAGSAEPAADFKQIAADLERQRQFAAAD